MQWYEHAPGAEGGAASRHRAPALSVILPTSGPEIISGVLDQLGKQTIASDIEIVVATSDPGGFDALCRNRHGFHSVIVVKVNDLDDLGGARARAVEAAGAACVFLGETHSFACVPDWAERLVTRYREGWAVVVPGFRNANPGTVLSWAGFLLDYGTWLDCLEAGEINYWPLNNACCDRLKLLESSGDTAHALSFGDQLLLAMRSAGCRVYLEPKATLRHLNITRWKPWLDERWIAGHLVAWQRSRDWSAARRVLYAAAAPVIAIVVFGRVWRPAWRSIRHLRLPALVLPTMFLAACVRAAGEAFGYVRLGNRAAGERRMSEYELNKAHYI